MGQPGESFPSVLQPLAVLGAGSEQVRELASGFLGEPLERAPPWRRSSHRASIAARRRFEDPWHGQAARQQRMEPFLVLRAQRQVMRVG